MSTKELIDQYNASKIADDTAAQSLLAATTAKAESQADLDLKAVALHDDLAANGPKFVLTEAPAVVIYRASDEAPGFTTETVLPA